MFRVLLFKFFNRIETWELLTRCLDARPAWAGYSFAAYSRILDEAMSRGERIYSAAYIVPSPPFGEARKHGNHLRLIERAMAGGLPRAVADAPGLREIPQASQPGDDRMRPVVAAACGYLECVGHLLHVIQQTGVGRPPASDGSRDSSG